MEVEGLVALISSARRLAIALALLFSAITPSCAASLHREALRIPMASAGPRGLEALLVRPNDQKRYPLALISHGSPRDGSERPEMSPYRYEAQAAAFARRGFAALVVMRRGYGTSGGSYVEGTASCGAPDYLKAGRTSAEDLQAAIAAMQGRSDVSLQGMIAIGQSAGGFATVALTANPPPGLVAAINFAGGRGSQAPGEVCSEPRLVDAFGTFGKTSRVPMLWIYTKNDQFFAPALAKQFYQAFSAAGGRAELVDAPPFGNDGHSFFASGIDGWTPYVDRFLRDRNLIPKDFVAAAGLDLPIPAQLSTKNHGQFRSYVAAGAHKAFAIAPNGSFGWRSGRRSIDEAKADALAACSEHASGCKIYAIDETVQGSAR